MLVVGHRGAKGLAPENTLAAFEKGLEYRVDEVELDVRVTSDGQTVVNHDPFVADPAGNHLEIANHSNAELKEHKPDLTTLEEAIKFIDRRVPIVVEVKTGVPTEPVIKILKDFLNSGWQDSDFCLASRNQPILLELHAAFPEISTMVIDYWSGVRATYHARQLGTKRIGMLEYWLWPGFIAGMKRGGYQLYSAPPATPQKERFFACFGLAGQTNNPRKARKWAKYGLAGVITDFPDRFDTK